MSPTSSTMTFHEMSLLQMQFQLDETREQITDLCKSQNEIQWELERKLIEEKELDAKIKRFKRILKSKYKSGAYGPEKQSALLPKTLQTKYPRGASTFSSTITILEPTSSQPSQQESTKQEQQSTPPAPQQTSDDQWPMEDDEQDDLLKSIDLSETKLNSANKDTPSE